MSHSDKQVARCLRSWIHCVRRVRRSGLRELQYQQSYSNLLAAAADAGPSIADRVIALIKPWASLQSLRNASDPLLIDLITQARNFESELNPKSSLLRIGGIAKPVLLLLSIGFAAAYLSLANNVQVEDGMRWSRITYYNVQGKLSNLSLLEQSGALATLLVVFGTILLRNTRKS